METYSTDVLKELIRQSGLKQTVLAYGVCDTGHLSNVLNGKRKLSGKLFNDLLTKMGHDPADYLHIQNLADIEVISKLTHLRYLLRAKEGDFVAECEPLIQELEPHAYTFSTPHAQQLWNCKASVLFFQRDYAGVRDTARQALALTRPTLFQSRGGSKPTLDTIFSALPALVLSCDEAGLFIKLAIGYGADPSASEPERNHLHIANEILANLWQSLIQLPDYNYEITNVKIMTLSNYTKILCMLNEHKHSIELCDEGVCLCERYWDGQHLPTFFFNKGTCLVAMGKKDEGQEYLRRTRLLLEGAGRTRELQIFTDLTAEQGLQV